ncbi:hypothetical protein [Paenibacillus sp. FSL H8-0260]|jgi:hypothetical protein|uniref:hypothetical protein n=1 Tax=Paenibacillus sp. FSL H8-0260 TaxID=2921380 RepID=UPI00324DE2A1
MSRFGRKLVMVGIWAGIGILLGMQFGGSGGSTVSKILPGWNASPTTPTSQVTGMQPQPQLQKNGVTQGGQTYVYVPMVIDPVTGAYTAVSPLPQNSNITPADPPQQVVDDYSTKSPEQILIPEEQKPTVDVLADKTAGLLQQASQKGIRWVVSLFASAEN